METAKVENQSRSNIVEFRYPNGKKYLIELNPTQNEVYHAIMTDHNKFVALGGGVRSGKSFLGCVLAMKLSEWKNNVGIICRNTYQELESIIFYELLRKHFLEPIFGDKYRYDKPHHLVLLPNGSQIIFQALRDSNGKVYDLTRSLMGRGLGWFWIDQSEMCTESNFNTLIHRLSLNNVPYRHGYVNFNPRGHDWNYKVFVNPSTKRKDTSFFQSKTKDNVKNLPQDYLDMVNKSMHKTWKDRWIDGSFNSWEGLVYPMWKEDIHVVPQLDSLPSNYKVFLSIDHGYNNPVAIGFFTVLKDGSVLQFDEYYERGKLIKDYYIEVMRKLKEKWKQDRVTGYVLMDPTAFKTTADGSTIENMFRELSERESFNIIPYKANNDKATGLNRVGSYLAIDPKLDNPFTKRKGSPRFFVTENCEKTRWEFAQYSWKKSADLNVDVDSGTDFENLPEETMKRNDHMMDAIRYFLMSRPQPSMDVDVRSFTPHKKYFQPLNEVTNY